MSEKASPVPAQSHESAQVSTDLFQPQSHHESIPRPSVPPSKNPIADDSDYDARSQGSNMSPKGKNSPQKTISPYVKSPIFHRKVSHEEYPGPETTLNTTSATTTPTKPIRRSSSAKDLMRLAIGPDGHSSFRTFSGEDHVDSKGLKPSRYQSRKVNNEAGPSFLAKKRQSDDDDDSSEFLAYSKASLNVLEKNPDLAFQEEPDYKLEFEFPYRNHADSYQEGSHVTFNMDLSMLVVNDPFIEENSQAAQNILKLLKIRDKYRQEHSDYSLINNLITYRVDSPEPIINYIFEKNILPKDDDVKKLQLFIAKMSYEPKDGVFIPMIKGKPIVNPISMKEYIQDLSTLMKESNKSINKTFCIRRLNVLQQKFELHLSYNREKEANESKSYYRDFFDIRKVDTHIHHSACMHVKLLLNFMIRKYHEEPNIQAIKEKSSGKILTIKEVFDKHNLSVYKLNVDHLDVRADQETFQRFDRFNKKYNPFSQTDLREIFLKHENFMGGRYLGEITKEVLEIYSENKYEFVEPRLSIYGKNAQEWQRLATWVNTYGLYNHHVRWLIQLPRLYSAYKETGNIQNFQNMLDNIFRPIFDVTINPSIDPSLYKFLLSVVGFDTVDDESIFEKSPSSKDLEITPEKYDRQENPHYCYWAYYIWVNVFTLNKFRKERGLNTFSFRPHSGEAGNADHLGSAYLLADSINHGIMLNKATVMQYLFYLKQIGLAMSPLSNNKLFMKYKKNPFPEFFKRGLNVSLSTDDPLIFHMTYQPLLEEYSIASQVFDLSSVDICEIARNSVLQSGYEDLLKSYWIGAKYKQDSDDSNDPTKTNVSPIRFRYRRETLKTELKELNYYAEHRK